MKEKEKAYYKDAEREVPFTHHQDNLEKEVMTMKHHNRRADVYRKGALSLAILALFVIALSLPSTAIAASKVKGQLGAAIEKLNGAYKNKDIKGVMAMYAKDPAVTAIGTVKDEKVVGPDAVKALYERDFNNFIDVKKMAYKIISFGSSGKIAWLAADMSATFVTKDGEMDIAGRLTAVLKKTGKKWQFVQTHFSFPVAAPQVIVMDFKQVDVNKDGKIDYKELSMVIKGLTAEDFRKYDKNNDGYLSDEEFQTIWKK